MKKIIIFLFALGLISCNKKENNIPHPEGVSQNTTQNILLPEMNASEVSSFLSNEKNDTIYVTNFFATWCGPCMHEIPYFKEKMNEMKNEKIKFTFINLDDPKDWSTKVNAFAQESGLEKNIVLFNHTTMPEDFFSKNFQQWDGRAIPFTLITKNDKRDEHIGMMSKEELTSKINALK